MKKHTFITKKRLHAGHVFDVFEEHVEIDGKIHTLDMVAHRGAVVLFPLTSRGTVYLVKQWRQAVQQVTLELPAGLLESGESLEDAARRECQEEIGWLPQKLTPFLTLLSAPGFTNEKLHVFKAEELIPHSLDGDETEDIEVCEMTLDDCVRDIANGVIVDAKTICTLYHYLQELR